MVVRRFQGFEGFDYSGVIMLHRIVVGGVLLAVVGGLVVFASQPRTKPLRPRLLTARRSTARHVRRVTKPEFLEQAVARRSGACRPTTFD